jgi:NAD(P)H dehydrogenase (quinone)
MPRTSILIGGATGATGSVATKLLLEKGFPVRAFVHKDDERAHKLQALGAEIFVGELLDFRAVRRAFEGIKRAYFVYPMRPGLVQATAHYAQAAKEAKAEFVLNMSQRTARSDALSDNALQHWLAERVFDWTGTPVTHLRPTAFNEWLLYMRKGISAGHYRVPFGPAGKFAAISAEDLGAVIAEILASPEPHAGQTYPLLGPIELTPPQIAEIVSQTLGKPVRYEQITGAQWVEEVSGTPNVPFLVQHISAIAEMHAQGLMAGTNDVVEKITGRKPQSVAEFVEKHRAALQ